MKNGFAFANLIEFFWGKADGSKGIHWLAVDKLCHSKVEGGLGFRELNAYNKSLLAKQCWRIINNPDSFWVKILKARYFPHCSFYDAVKGSRASWGWNSILSGRDIIIEKALWQVNNGKSIDVWRDAWLPGIPGGKITPITTNNRFTPLAVNKIIDEDSANWRIKHIVPFLHEKEAKIIRAIPLCNLHENDRLIWPLDKHGCYTVKSGYHYIMENRRTNMASTSKSIDKCLWNLCWKRKTPPQVNIFVWKALNSALPVMLNLRRRKITTTATCKICEDADESVEHCLFLCPWAKCTWFGSALG